MRRRRAIIAATVLLALAAFAAGLLLSSSPERRESSPLPSQAAIARLLATPLFDLSGKETLLTRWRGKPLIINFWATWCPPCLTEMPVFSRLQEKHPEVQFVGIAVDTRHNVQEFVAATPLSYPLLLGSEGIMSLMAELGNNRNGLPFTLAIDASSQVREVRLGGLSEPEAERLITGLR